MTVYRWKPHSCISVDAQAAGSELEKIRVRHNGRLDQEGVVRSAKDENSPLHQHFEWDDKKAAHKHRLDQAGHLIRSIEITIQPTKKAEEVKFIRAYVNVERERDRAYVNVSEAMSDPALKHQVIRRAWKDLEAWKKRYEELVEFADVFAVIDQARDAS